MPIVAILGATSPIANVVARQFAAEGCDLVLTARDPHAIAEAADRIATGFSINVEHHALDAGDEQSVSALIESFGEHFPDVVICLLGKQEEAGQSRAETVVLDGLVSANLVMPAMLLERCAAKMMERGSGSIIGVSSIVGDRGRQKNYWYGAAKAGFTAYLSGLRQRLTPLGIHVMTVKPGVVAIPGVRAVIPLGERHRLRRSPLISTKDGSNAGM